MRSYRFRSMYRIQIYIFYDFYTIYLQILRLKLYMKMCKNKINFNQIVEQMKNYKELNYDN